MLVVFCNFKNTWITTQLWGKAHAYTPCAMFSKDLCNFSETFSSPCSLSLRFLFGKHKSYPTSKEGMNGCFGWDCLIYALPPKKGWQYLNMAEQEMILVVSLYWFHFACTAIFFCSPCERCSGPKLAKE